MLIIDTNRPTGTTEQVFQHMSHQRNQSSDSLRTVADSELPYSDPNNFMMYGKEGTVENMVQQQFINFFPGSDQPAYQEQPMFLSHFQEQQPDQFFNQGYAPPQSAPIQGNMQNNWMNLLPPASGMLDNQPSGSLPHIMDSFGGMDPQTPLTPANEWMYSPVTPGGMSYYDNNNTLFSPNTEMNRRRFPRTQQSKRAAAAAQAAAAAAASHHPYRYNKWTMEEDEALKMAIKRVLDIPPHERIPNNVDLNGKWTIIAPMVGSRNPMQCSARWSGALNPKNLKGKWTQEEDSVLVAAVRAQLSYGTKTEDIAWQRVAQEIHGRTAVQCAARYQEALDPSIKKGKWTPEEDAQLKQGLEMFGTAWVKIAQNVPNRTQRQCRTRWLQMLQKDPNCL